MSFEYVQFFIYIMSIGKEILFNSSVTVLFFLLFWFVL